MRATVSHFEIPARDPERAARFYRHVFGWSVEPLAWGGHAYFKIRGSAVPVDRGYEGIEGGLSAAGHGVEQPLLMIHLAGISLEDCLRKIEEAGGRVEKAPEAVGGFGRWARFRDCEGNLLGLWEATSSAPPPPASTP
jgi:predicted enzyme related to lactoylglutathione lyase